MTTPLPDEKLADIEARKDAATPGPWGVYQFGGDSLIEIAADLEDTGCGYRARRTICRFDEEPLDNDPAHREWTAEEDWAQVQADAEFAAHAREDVDALAAEVRRLQADLATEQAQHALTLRQRNNRSERLNYLRDIAESGQTELLAEEALNTLAASINDHMPADGDEMAASLRRDGFGADEIADMLGPGVTEGEAVEPVQLRWGLNDVQYGDDDSVIVMLSGPDREAYWLELDQERANALRANLAGPDGEQPGPDTLPAWLHRRFAGGVPAWEWLDDSTRAYWEHQAAAVRRAVKRGGFKTSAAPAAVPAAETGR